MKCAVLPIQFLKSIQMSTAIHSNKILSLLNLPGWPDHCKTTDWIVEIAQRTIKTKLKGILKEVKPLLWYMFVFRCFYVPVGHTFFSSKLLPKSNKGRNNCNVSLINHLIIGTYWKSFYVDGDLDRQVKKWIVTLEIGTYFLPI